MQYIQKQNTPPPDWDTWFTTATSRRTFDYGADYGAMTNLNLAKQYLIDEQYGLCAYCQQKINLGNSSIEHVIPKEFNLTLSTCYYNLVAVCKTPPKEPVTGKLHCDKEKQSKMITPFIFVTNSDVTIETNNSYFSARVDGTLRAKDHLGDDDKIQVEAFINILHLNHSTLIGNRNEAFNGIFDVYKSIDPLQRDSFWRSQFNSLMLNRNRDFRQFLLILIASRMGIN